MAAASANQAAALAKGRLTGGNPGGMSKPLREVRKLAQSMLPEAMAKLGEIMRTAEPRVALEAVKVILVRGIGKEREHEGLYPGKDKPLASSPLGEIDLKTLTDSQLDRIDAIIKETAS